VNPTTNNDDEDDYGTDHDHVHDHDHVFGTQIATVISDRGH
jgi:hypothetical protein